LVSIVPALPASGVAARSRSPGVVFQRRRGLRREALVLVAGVARSFSTEARTTRET